MIVQELLDELGIRRYSVSWGNSRSLKSNHKSEIVMIAYNKYLKTGAFIVQGKKKLMGQIIQNEGKVINPTSLLRAYTKIREIQESKIEYEEVKEAIPQIQELIKIEQQKEVEEKI